MKRVSLSGAEPDDGAVFVDNLALSSLMRVLTGAYDSLPNEYFAHSAAAQLLFAHDLVNMAGILEALICHEELYVNAAFMSTWTDGLGTGADQLAGLVTGVSWTKEFQWRAESAIVKSDWPRTAGRSPPDEPFGFGLSSVVSASTHHEGTSSGVIEFDDSLAELTSYKERTRPFGSGMDVVVGTGFYTACSQILGIPYRPSALRATYLDGILRDAIRDFRADVGREAFAALEDSREKAVIATSFTARMAEMNRIDTAVPAVLTAVLGRARSRKEILPVTLQLRDSAGGRKFRKWNAELVRAIQSGDLKDAARQARTIENVVKDVNRSFGLDSPEDGFISVGWGPVSAGKTFALPRQLSLPIRFSRHAWFLQRMYDSMLSVARLEDRVDRLLVRPLSRAFRKRLATGRGLQWKALREPFRGSQKIYRPE
jgi:hypothetical protein